MGAVTDTCIAAALCVLLQRGRTGFRRSDTLINRLILFTINAGLATSVFAVLGLVFVTAYPSNLIYVTMYVPISRREYLRQKTASSTLGPEVLTQAFF